MQNLTWLFKKINILWQRGQLPSRLPSSFQKIDNLVIFLICIVISIISSFKLLDLKPLNPEIIFSWSLTFFEIQFCCMALIFISKKENPTLNARQIILILGLLLIAQGIKLNFSTFSPLSIIVPPALIISQGMGTLTALTWVSIACINWPGSVNLVSNDLLLITFISASIVSILGGKIRGRAQLLQISILVPFGALISQWIILFVNNENYRYYNISNFLISPRDIFSDFILLAILMLVTILIMPILESIFGLLTKARLLELADQEKPLLRKLSVEAPGTFEHTLLICGLAEEATRMIGGDIDLIRTGALYHDIGKLHAPNWFIENQTGSTNPHEKLDNPVLSAKILQDHVDKGLSLARKYRLPKPLASFIPEHQGTLKMGYFLHKARESDPSASEKRFRYKGPIPHSKETGILMLADGCEAALRSLDGSSTDSDACKTVRKIIQSRQLDGQLKESSLTRAEIEIILRAFVSVWRRMRHRRLKYPSLNPR